MLPELIEITTSITEKRDAQTIAALLVERRLAACTQVSGPIESSYWWNDRMETAQEWQITIKTSGTLYSAVEAAILESHPYDEPEIIALPIVSVSPGYRSWLLAQLAIPLKRPVDAGQIEVEAAKLEKTTQSAVAGPKKRNEKKGAT